MYHHLSLLLYLLLCNMLVKLQGLTDACNALIHFSSLKYTWYSTEQTVNKLQLETIGQFRLSHPVEVKPTKKKSV